MPKHIDCMFLNNYNETETKLKRHLDKYGHVSSISNKLTIYDEPRLNSNGATDLITKT